MVEDVVRALGHLCLGTRFKRLGERLQADTQRIIDEHGVGVQAGQYPLLAAIDRLGPLSIGELAESIGITQPGATRAVNQLVELGLLGVEQAEDDQRRKVISLTAGGQRVVNQGRQEVWPCIEGAVAELCGGLAGPLLDQLAAIEDGLAERSLAARAGARKDRQP